LGQFLSGELRSFGQEQLDHVHSCLLHGNVERPLGAREVRPGLALPKQAIKADGRIHIDAFVDQRLELLKLCVLGRLRTAIHHSNHLLELIVG
jgi:hypothetical protein